MPLGGARARVDEEATQQMLQSLLLNKNMGGDEAPAELTAASGPNTPMPESAPRTLRSPVSTAPLEGVVSSAVIAEIHAEKAKFVDEVCASTTRLEVQDWIRKIVDMHAEGRLVAARREALERRRRRPHGGSVAYSESSVSGVTGYTGYTGHTGYTAATPTALQTVGGAVLGRAPRSVDSAESLVVHHSGVEEPLSVKERVQAYLSRGSPELEEHVNAHLARRMETLQSKVDDKLATKFLRQTQERRVFDGRANYLRWQSARHQVLQKQLDKNMPHWILDAIESWDQKKVEGKSEKDLVFDFLTKRAAHIDSGKLPTEIPIFKTLHTSYSLPTMWSDKFIS